MNRSLAAQKLGNSSEMMFPGGKAVNRGKFQSLESVLVSLMSIHVLDLRGVTLV